MYISNIVMVYKIKFNFIYIIFSSSGQRLHLLKREVISREVNGKSVWKFSHSSCLSSPLHSAFQPNTKHITVFPVCQASFFRIVFFNLCRVLNIFKGTVQLAIHYSKVHFNVYELRVRRKNFIKGPVYNLHVKMSAT